MFIYEIRDQAVAQGVGVYGTNIFIGSKAAIPPGDGPYLTLTETGGSGASRSQNTATERPTLQAVVRASTTAAARTMMTAFYNAMGGANGLHNVILGGSFYLSITARQSTPTDIGLDADARPMFSMNFDAERSPDVAPPPDFWIDGGASDSTFTGTFDGGGV